MKYAIVPPDRNSKRDNGTIFIKKRFSLGYKPFPTNVNSSYMSSGTPIANAMTNESISFVMINSSGA